MFSGLFGFGVLNAILGPALPYLRAEEHLSYLPGALHQLAFAVGGGLAGLLAIRVEARLGRGVTIRFGLAAAAVAGLAVGYGDAITITVPGAFFMSLFGTSALIRMWAALADAHGPRRTVAMTEGGDGEPRRNGRAANARWRCGDCADVAVCVRRRCSDCHHRRIDDGRRAHPSIRTHRLARSTASRR
jgi:hypothetical protein